MEQQPTDKIGDEISFSEFCKSKVYSHTGETVEEQAEREQHIFPEMSKEEIMKMWFENHNKPSIWD